MDNTNAERLKEVEAENSEMKKRLNDQVKLNPMES